MKKKLILLLVLMFQICFAVDISVNAPSKVQQGEIFTLEVYAKNVSNCGGFECDLYVSNNLKILNVTSYNVGADYNLTINKNSFAAIQYAFLTNPKNEDFKVGEFKIKALKSGNATIVVKAVASDSEGNAIKIPEKVINLKVESNQVNEEKKETGFSFNIVVVIFAIILVGILIYMIRK